MVVFFKNTKWFWTSSRQWLRPLITAKHIDYLQYAANIPHRPTLLHSLPYPRIPRHAVASYEVAALEHLGEFGGRDDSRINKIRIPSLCRSNELWDWDWLVLHHFGRDVCCNPDRIRSLAPTSHHEQSQRVVEIMPEVWCELRAMTAWGGWTYTDGPSAASKSFEILSKFLLVFQLS